MALGTAERSVLGIGIVFPNQLPGQADDKVYFSADLSQLAVSDGYIEGEDLSLLEDVQHEHNEHAAGRARGFGRN